MRTALYRMANNKYLGDCIAVVAEFEADEVAGAGLTRPQIVAFLKVSERYWRDITSIELLQNTPVFKDVSPLLRVGSECMYGMFGDTHCDCESERRSVLREMKHHAGIYIHLPQEAQGMGLFYKTEELHLQTTGYKPDGEYLGEQSQANAARALTGRAIIDARGFDVVAQVLRFLRLDGYHYRLVTRSPSKKSLLTDSGVNVAGTVNAAALVSPDNLGEYLTKWLYKGYPLGTEQCEQIIEVLSGSEPIPVRAASLVAEAKLMLSDEQNGLISRLGDDDAVRGRFVESIRNPTNTNLVGAQSHLLTLLEQAEAYDEFQYELVLDDELDAYVVSHMRPVGDTLLWHEQNHYFYLPSVSQMPRDLKIRVTYNMSGVLKIARLIHKVQVAPYTYRIRTVDFSDAVFVDILKNSVFADYEQRLVESITHPYAYGEGMKVIIKRYGGDLRTISIEGREAEVRAWRQQVEDALNRRLTGVVPDTRSFGPRVAGAFDLASGKRLEFQRLGRYSGIIDE